MISAGVLTVSDRATRGERDDLSGPTLVGILEGRGWQVARTAIVPDERQQIAAILTQWADKDGLNLILTTGGTGFSPRDVTPEATLDVCQRTAPGLSEAMRRSSAPTTPYAILSRAVAGIRDQTLIVNLPGSPRGAKENLEVILPALPHAVAVLSGEPGAEAGHHDPKAHGHL